MSVSREETPPPAGDTSEQPESRQVEKEALPSYKVPLPLWTQLFRFLIAFFISTFILAGALLITHARMPDMPWLPDVFLEWLPKVSWFEAFTNICIAILNVTLGYTALKLFVLHWFETRHTTIKIPCNIPYIGDVLNKFLFGILDSGRRPHPIRNAYLIAAIRFLTVYMVMMLYRCVTIVVTSYPATDNHCRVKPEIKHPFLNMILTVVTLGSGAIHCGDLLFSGHTIILCLAFCLCWQYGLFLYKRIWLFRLYLLLVLLFAFFAILVSRSHYTNDIVVAAYCTITTYMLLRHDQDGAPWQLQMIIRYWPCPLDAKNPEWEAQHAAAATAGRNGLDETCPAVVSNATAVDIVVEDDGAAASEVHPPHASRGESMDRTTTASEDLEVEVATDDPPKKNNSEKEKADRESKRDDV